MQSADITLKMRSVYLIEVCFLTCIKRFFVVNGKTKITLISGIVANGLNIIGNALFIFVFKWGVFGANLSTLLCEVVEIALLFFILNNKKSGVKFRFANLKPDFKLIKKLFGLGLPIGLENNLSSAGKLLVSALVAKCGTDAINANAAAHSLTTIFIVGANPIGNLTGIVVGQCLGAGKLQEARYWSKRLFFLSSFMLAVMCGGILLFMTPLLNAYNLSEGALAIAQKIVIPYITIGIVFWMLCYTVPSALRAGGDVKFTMFCSLGTLWVCRVGLAYLFFYLFNSTIYAIWAASYVDWLVRGTLNVIRYRGKRWMNRLV